MSMKRTDTLRKMQRTVNSIFIGALCWIIGYVIGANIAYYLVPDFYLAGIEGKTIISFLFATLAIIVLEIIRERRNR